MRGANRFLIAFLATLVLACPPAGRESPSVESRSPPDAGVPKTETAAAEAREAMVRDQIESRGIESKSVLAAMRVVPRHRFLPEHVRQESYEDHPVPIGHEQTISQPYVVALMSELAQVEPGDNVLEIGTGSGYQAAVLEEMGARVWSIEIVEPLATSAAALLRDLGHDRVTVRYGDGYMGWEEEAPFDAILLTAAPIGIPKPLLDQLAPGGRLVAPVGRWYQELVVVESGPDGLVAEKILPVRFVPMTGRAQSEPLPP